MRLNVFDQDMFLAGRIDEEPQGVLSGHILAHQIVNGVVEEVVAHDVR